MSTYSAPFLLRWAAAPAGTHLCAQASYAGVEANVTLRQIDFGGNTPTQLWQFGDDGRISLAGSQNQPGGPFCIGFTPLSNPNASLNGTSLFLEAVVESEATQTWDLSTAPPTIINTGASMGGIRYVLDSGGSAVIGNSVVIFGAGSNNYNQEWVLQTLPALVLAEIPA